MKKLRWILCVVLTVAMLAAVGLPVTAAPLDASTLRLTARAAITMDYDTGEILYAKDIDTMRVPASMTKIMTAYIIFEEMEKGNLTLDSEFTISDHARNISYNPSYNMAVALVGKTITVDQALKNILVPSASATCIVAAENISGSEEAFVQRMNETAKRLGMQAEYQNSHGARVHYMTCRSVAILMRDFIMRYPAVLNYTSLKYITYGGGLWGNTNKLLSDYNYEGCDGFKTGTIAESGYCLAATAKRNGRRVITVLMGSANNTTRHTESIKLLDLGFAEIAKRDESRNAAEATLTVEPDRPLRAGAYNNVKLQVSQVATPFAGTFDISIGGKSVGRFTSEEIINGEYPLSLYLDASYEGKTSVDATISLTMPNVDSRSFHCTLPVSDAPACRFNDIAYHWAEQDITKAADNQWVTGYQNNSFRPDDSITRAEFVSILARLLNPEAVDITEDSYTDVGNHWARDSIELLTAAGYINGYHGRFRPDDEITRQEAATVLYRALTEKPEQVTLPYADADEVAPWAKDAVGGMSYLGLLNGYDNGTFRPQGSLTRAECVRMVINFSRTLEQNPE